MHSFSLDYLANHVNKGPFLGLDWGKKRVGISISDEENKVAMPLQIVDTGGVLRTVLENLWQAHQVKALILGWPLHMDGRESPLCAPILRLATRLHQAHQWSIGLWDERLSSLGAYSLCSHRSRRTEIHHHAAAVILQGAIHRWTALRHPEKNLC